MTNSAHKISIKHTFRNTESTDAIKNYANEKLENCLRKFVHHDTEAHVVHSVEKNRHIVEVAFHTDGADFVCKEETENLYASIDSAVKIISQQLRKHKERMTAHH